MVNSVRSKTKANPVRIDVNYNRTGFVVVHDVQRHVECQMPNHISQPIHPLFLKASKKGGACNVAVQIMIIYKTF